jgi:hypothetical protein
MLQQLEIEIHKGKRNKRDVKVIKRKRKGREELRAGI